MCWALSDGSSKLIPIDEQPITRSCICSVLEKQIVRRINRFAQFIRVWLGKEMISLSPPPRRTVRTSHLVHGSSNLRTPRGALLL